MYALNTFLRVVSFVSRSLVGLAAGFFLGYTYATGIWSVGALLAPFSGI